MSRRRFVFRKTGDGEYRMVELDLDAPLPPRVTPYVVRDIQPYHSVLTREVIGSRSEHRAHLRQHGVVEMGNEMPRPSREPLPSVRDDVEFALQASPERRAEAMKAEERATDALPITRILP